MLTETQVHDKLDEMIINNPDAWKTVFEDEKNCNANVIIDTFCDFVFDAGYDLHLEDDGSGIIFRLLDKDSEIVIKRAYDGGKVEI